MARRRIITSRPLRMTPRALLATALRTESETPLEITAQRVETALEALLDRYVERRQRELRVQMAEAQRRGDDNMLRQLAQEKMRLEKERHR